MSELFCHVRWQTCQNDRMTSESHKDSPRHELRRAPKPHWPIVAPPHANWGAPPQKVTGSEVFFSISNLPSSGHLKASPGNPLPPIDSPCSGTHNVQAFSTGTLPESRRCRRAPSRALAHRCQLVARPKIEATGRWCWVGRNGGSAGMTRLWAVSMEWLWASFVQQHGSRALPLWRRQGRLMSTPPHPFFPWQVKTAHL